MDENQNNDQQAAQPVRQEAASQNQPSVSGNYASFGQRLVAMLIDGLVLFIVSLGLGFVFGLVFGISAGTDASASASTTSWLLSIVSWAYYVYFTANKGATPGKMVMNIRVQNMETGQNLTYIEAFLREVVGKFLSAIVLALGYFWMLWDDNKQTWHDKLAKSVVVKTK